MKLTIGRNEHFNAAHRLHNPEWSDEENKRVFGVCNNPNYHGHNYDLTVKITGEVDTKSGYLIDLKSVSDILKKHVIHKFDHKNLNLDTEEFKTLNPTVENIAMVIWNILRREIEEEYDIKVILYETERNFVEYPA